MPKPGECSAATLLGAGAGGAIAGALFGAFSGPLSTAGGFDLGGACGMAGAAIGCAMAIDVENN
ncbi:MAG TPA: hypothetical protein VME63_03335 [Dyella sp.]|uniref:hypothetical protein n=1 Tax=Dyella sp. TaxID=1869338 RepID=UPI002C5ACA13|nr:hypothetical protein [Dyella sp.]HTV84408.1 hypothetical protein [Dyella sp.]